MRDRTDLERLRGAFTELSERGFGADFDLAWRAFTPQDAAAETPRGPKGFVYSYAQTYANAFFAEEGWGVAEQPMPDWVKNEIEEMKPRLLAAAGIDADVYADVAAKVESGEYLPESLSDEHLAMLEKWQDIGDNHRRSRAALEHERIHRWHTLLSPLAIRWHSPEHLDEIIEVLDSHGLDVTPPPDEKTVIRVNPSQERSTGSPDSADDRLRELVLRLYDAPTGDWSRQALLPLVNSLEDARLLPVEDRFGFPGEFAGLAVPLGSTDPSPMAQADRFKQVAEALRDVLGAASIAGSHGTGGPAWGSPYLRWFLPLHSLELRAGAHGPELVVAPTEHWTSRLAHGEVGGLLGRLRTNAFSLHTPDPATLPLPTASWAADWETFEPAFASWLTTVSADQHALGLRLAPAIHGVGGLLVDVYPQADRLLIGGTADNVDMPALGWVPGPFPGDPWDDYPEWRLAGDGIGRTDGKAMARTVVATARAAGVSAPTQLKIMHGVRVETSPGTEYDLTFYELGLQAAEGAW